MVPARVAFLVFGLGFAGIASAVFALRSLQEGGRFRDSAEGLALAVAFLGGAGFLLKRYVRRP